MAYRGLQETVCAYSLSPASAAALCSSPLAAAPAAPALQTTMRGTPTCQACPRPTTTTLRWEEGFGCK